MSRTITLAGYAVLALAFLACQLWALVTGRMATLGQAASWVVRRPAGRWLLLAGWLWIGWHLFVRSHAGS